MSLEKIEAAIRDVPDFPEPGILFKDITPILHDGDLFAAMIDLFVERYQDHEVDRIAGVDARGFIIGAALALKLNKGFIPVRKKGKLPYESVEQSYDLEYGSNTLAMHVDAVREGERILLIDDLLATGGTLQASADLIKKLGGEVSEIAVLVELAFLNGRSKIDEHPIWAPISY